MNIETFEKLQLKEVKELIKEYCVSSLGKELIDKVNPSDNFNIVKRRLSENKEARKILENSNYNRQLLSSCHFNGSCNLFTNRCPHTPHHKS